MSAMAYEPHTTVAAPAARDAAGGSQLLCRFEGELRGSSRYGRCSEGVRFVHDLVADVVGGPFTGERLSGLDEITIRPDGTVLLAGAQTIVTGREPLILDLRGFVVPPTGTEWPSPRAMATPGYEFPDADLLVRGTALVRTTDPRHAHLDGVTVTVEGWLNFESGELEVEAHTMQ